MSIQTEAKLAALKEVGRIVRLALDAMESAVRPGVSTQELADIGGKVMRDSRLNCRHKHPAYFRIQVVHSTCVSTRRFPMDENILQEVFEELFQSLETAETQSAAIVQFLKGKGMASEEDLAPYLEQASKASSVRWVATRARINRLLSAANSAEKSEDTQSPGPAEQEPTNSAGEQPLESAGSSRIADDTKQAPRGQQAKDESPNHSATPSEDSSQAAAAEIPPEGKNSQPSEKSRKPPEAA